jgi:hypothetical protein
VSSVDGHLVELVGLNEASRVLQLHAKVQLEVLPRYLPRIGASGMGETLAYVKHLPEIRLSAL